jgi:hypothetical protein
MVEPEYYEGLNIPAIDELCESAVQDDRWSDQLRLASEVHACFLVNRQRWRQ